MWFPLLLWSSSLAFASYLGSRRAGWVPERIPAKTAILASQGMFVVFWILLGCIQQVQEMVNVSFFRAAIQQQQLQQQQYAYSSLSSSSSPPTFPATVLEQGDNQLFSTTPSSSSPSAPVSFRDSYEFLHTARVPLWIVWHMAIVLLGLGTGMMTSCAQQLESDLYAAYYDEQDQDTAEAVMCDEPSKGGSHGMSEAWWSRGVASAGCARGGNDCLSDDRALCQGGEGEEALKTEPPLAQASCTLVHPRCLIDGHPQQQQQQATTVTMTMTMAKSTMHTTAAATRSTRIIRDSASISIFRSPLLSRPQRVFLAVLLFALQMGLASVFHWMVKVDRLQSWHDQPPQHHSSAEDEDYQSYLHSPTLSSASPSPATFGMFVAVVIMAIGARLLPRQQQQQACCPRTASPHVV
ncbi:hypothetical protein BGZ73_007972 [Actinomortierella ambigua]|nr:hypothetical protein BGZ73_007972 [Actinomortierella ambigua]